MRLTARHGDRRAVRRPSRGLLIGIPVLRLQGDYLAIVTLAFGEIIKNIINCLYHRHRRQRPAHQLHAPAPDVTGPGRRRHRIHQRPHGRHRRDDASPPSPAGFILILVALFVVLNLVNSRAGRAIMAIRDNRIAAESVGINVTKYKLMAFVHLRRLRRRGRRALRPELLATITASKFDFNTSILILVFVVLGGMGNIRGSIIAATVLTVLPEAAARVCTITVC